MFKKILPYEIGKVLLLALVILSLLAMAYGAYWLVWYLIQLLISPLPSDFILQIADELPESVEKLGVLVHKFFINPALQKEDAFTIAPGIPIRSVRVNL